MVIYMKQWSENADFDWDDGNTDKNWERHRVTDAECEEVFFNEPIVLRHDPSHSATEPRWRALGQTDEGRYLFVAFTVRSGRLRIISAREMTRREKTFYEKNET